MPIGSPNQTCPQVSMVANIMAGVALHLPFTKPGGTGSVGW